MRNKEGRRSYGTVIGNSLLIAALGLASIPLFNYQTTSRVIPALLNIKDIDCSQGELPFNKNTSKIAIVVPGAGFDKYGNPNADMIVRLKGAAVEYINIGEYDHPVIVVIQDGILPKGVDPTLTTKYLQYYVNEFSKHSRTILKDNVFDDISSFNTSSGMHSLAMNKNLYGAETFVVIDSKSHGNRSTADGCDDGLSMSWKSAEDLVENNKSKPVPLFIIAKEDIELFLNIYFPGGRETEIPKIISLELRKLKSGQELDRYLIVLSLISLLMLRKKNLLKKKRLH